MIFSSQLASDLAECETKTEWLNVLQTALGSGYKFIARESNIPKITVTYSEQVIHTNAVQAWITNDYTALSITEADKDSLVWRIESADGSNWVELTIQPKLTNDPDSDQGFSFKKPIYVRAPSNLPEGATPNLLSWENFNRLGAFMAPWEAAYTESGVGWDYDNNRLLLAGLYRNPEDGDGPQQARFVLSSNVPGSLGTSTSDPETLPVSVVHQSPILPVGDAEFDIGPGEPMIVGQMVHNSVLHIGYCINYDASNEQTASHFTRNPDLTSGSPNVIGPLDLSGALPRQIGGAMTLVPEEWQSVLGKALIGIGGVNTHANASVGPSICSFDPDDLEEGVIPMALYPLSNPLTDLYGENLLQGYSNISWNQTAVHRGTVILPGWRSVLCFGRMGVGPMEYSGGGFHCPSYTTRVWAYDINDLAAARRGEVAPYLVKPYALWNIDLPFSHSEKKTSGAFYEPVNDRVYVSCPSMASSGRVGFHVFEVS